MPPLGRAVVYENSTAAVAARHYPRLKTGLSMLDASSGSEVNRESREGPEQSNVPLLYQLARFTTEEGCVGFLNG
jgi:hypothetical protein